MPHDSLSEEHRRFREMLRRHRDEMEAARRELKDTMKRAQEERKESSNRLRDLLAALSHLPRPNSGPSAKRHGKRRGRGEPDAGGVPVEPNKPLNLSGGAAV